MIKNLIKAFLRFLLRFRWLVRLGNWVLKDQPVIRTKIGSVKMHSYGITKPTKNNSEILESLPESARLIYAQLKDSYGKTNHKTEKY
jgi:hypothetical protein